MTCIYCAKEIQNEAFSQTSLYSNEPDTFCNKSCAAKYLKHKEQMMQFEIKNSYNFNLRTQRANAEAILLKIKAIRKEAKQPKELEF